ncbi:hypothetical protein ABL78_4527 [Leptomonas seymouri]|uniref:Kinesin motor domain-containing protein n=1 Tax=Leptomonas seymouri TaxID=5684 RepID=A0A0N1IK61_LEPSE|nr:hypothetical protein ABL78_4527 [Leptomonas seymouri]|eukprot:KPI86411.1 hypothetical protein ABL78_4527 [Leptomonas seymouri]
MRRDREPSRPRVCVALRWRESRTWMGERCAEGAKDEGDFSSLSATNASRLCVLRHRSDARGPPRLIADGVNAGMMKSADEVPVVGLGMRTQPPASPSLTRRPPPSPQRSIEIAVETPFISIEGLSASASLSRREHAQPRRIPPSDVPPFAWSSSPSPLQALPSPAQRYSDAHLTQGLAELIATELTGHSVSSSSSARPRSSAVERFRHREVLTFTMGVEGSGKTVFVVGGVQGGDAAVPRASPESLRSDAAPASDSSPPTGGLFRAVLDRLFQGRHEGHPLSVAVSVVEIRDSAPLRHPSVMQRPRETVDLLSGQLLDMQEGHDAEDSTVVKGRDSCRRECSDDGAGSAGSAASSAVADQPTDIPAACYVRVQSSAEAAQVLHTALRSSVAWQPCTSAGACAAVELAAAAHPSSSPPLACLLRPAGLPREEQTSHLCVTVLVGHAADARRGTATTPSSVGIWKLWDVSGPSPSCGYRPYKAADEGHPSGSKGKESAVEADVDARDTVEVGPAGTQLKPILPWHNRYSLPSLTHTCLTAFGCSLARSSRSDLPLLQYDATALQIAASASESCSLVIPVCTVAAEATADAVNAEVLRCAGGWAEHGRRLDIVAKVSKDGKARSLARRCWEENAMAAQRVLDDYAVCYDDFIKQRLAVYAHEAPPVPSHAPLTHGMSNDEPGVVVALTPGALTALGAHPETFQSIEAPSRPTQVVNCFGAPTLLPTHSKAMEGAAAPLSINVTASDEDQLAAMRALAYSKDTSDSSTARAAPQTLGSNAGECTQSSRADGTFSASPATPLRETLSENLVHTPQHLGEESTMTAEKPSRATTTTMPVPPKQASVAAMCAAAAVEAEDVRLQRFQRVFATESFHVTEEPSWASLEAEALAVCLPSDVSEPADPHEREHQRPQEPPHTPVKRNSSPPSVLRTGPRAVSSAAPPPSSEALLRRACQQQSPLPAPQKTASQLTDKEEVLSCKPQELRYDTSELPHQLGEQRTELTADSEAASMETSNRKRDPAAAAIVQCLAPYCDEFIKLYENMRRDVATWRTTEAASLQALSELSEQHTRDIQQLTQLLRQTSSQQASADLKEAGKPAVLGTSSDGVASALASTSALIFEQLVKSEEKVTWLERQLVQWRQLAHKASMQPYSNAEEGGDITFIDCNDAESSAAVPAIDRQGLSAAILSESDGAVEDNGADPTRRHVAQAQCILHRLLQRCGRAYASAQQRSVRWQEQLTQEHASTSALMDRVTELERELAGHRCRRDAGSTKPPKGVSSTYPPRASPGATQISTLCYSDADALHSAPKRRPGGYLPNGSSALSSVDLSGTALTQRTRGNCIAASILERGAEELSGLGCSAPTCATPAQVSPIQSPDDTALSLPSHSADRRRTGVPSAQSTPLPGGGDPMLSSAASSISSSAAVVPSQLAALLSRAVESDQDHRRLCGNRGATVPHAPLATVALFDVHVGSISSAADTAVRGGGSDVEGAVPPTTPRGFSAPSSRPPSIRSPSALPLHAEEPNRQKARGSALDTPRPADPYPAHPSSMPYAEPPDLYQGPPLHRSRSSPLSKNMWRAASCGFTEPQVSLSTESGVIAQRSQGAQVEGQGGATRSTALTHHSATAHDGFLDADSWDDSYPTVSLQRLQQAATEVATSAVRLTQLGIPTADAEGTLVNSASHLFQQTLNDPRRRPVQASADRISAVRDGWGEANEDDFTQTSLSHAMAQLRSASQAVQREAREAAERERAYLSTILFSDAAPDGRSGT